MTAVAVFVVVVAVVEQGIIDWKCLKWRHFDISAAVVVVVTEGPVANKILSWHYFGLAHLYDI